MRAEKPTSTRSALLVAGALGIILVVAIVGAVGVWSETGDVGMSGHGWVAMALGILVTLALGGGLMALVFYSSRRGYDEAASSGDEHDNPPGG